MTKKDYVLIAAALKNAHSQTHRCPIAAFQGWRITVDCIADTLAAESTRFERARFLQACGVQS